MRPQILLLIVFLLFEKISTAQSLNGNWKGTSICQLKNSPCHDEIVIYHISGDNGNNSYQVSAGKIVDGKELDMGILNFSFDPQRKILFSVDSARNVKWEFKVTGKEMHGTLVSKGSIYRIVDLKKED
jgi:hypothetical protein